MYILQNLLYFSLYWVGAELGYEYWVRLYQKKVIIT